MKKELFLMMICLLILSFVFAGCDVEEKIPEIDKKFHGKWETLSITVTNPYLPRGGETIALPDAISWLGQINSRGYLITATSITQYKDGEISYILEDVHSKGNQFHGGSNWRMIVEGDNAKLDNGDYADNLIKVSEFSWE